MKINNGALHMLTAVLNCTSRSAVTPKSLPNLLRFIDHPRQAYSTKIIGSVQGIIMLYNGQHMHTAIPARKWHNLSKNRAGRVMFTPRLLSPNLHQSQVCILGTQPPVKTTLHLRTNINPDKSNLGRWPACVTWGIHICTRLIRMAIAI